MTDRRHDAKRRHLIAGAGTAGALAAGAALVPLAPQPAAGPLADAKPPTDGKTGYRLTDHVLRYYQTARI